MLPITMRYKMTEVTDFESLLSQYPNAELRSPRRSTVPLLAFWRDPAVALEQLSRALGEQLSAPVDISFEHQVAVKAGRGKASHTDVMIHTPTHTVAIEAKSTEPGYESVSEWRKKGGALKKESPPKEAGSSGNRDQVLKGWLELINKTLNCSLTLENTDTITYQLIHRTASACEGSATTRIVAYQCFNCCPDEKDEYRSQMRRLRQLVGNHANLRFAFLDCSVKEHDAFKQLLGRWDKKERNLEPEVRKGLRQGSLLTIGSCAATFV